MTLEEIKQQARGLVTLHESQSDKILRVADALEDAFRTGREQMRERIKEVIK